jgi:hypothetical protein
MRKSAVSSLARHLDHYDEPPERGVALSRVPTKLATPGARARAVAGSRPTRYCDDGIGPSGGAATSVAGATAALRHVEVWSNRPYGREHGRIRSATIDQRADDGLIAITSTRVSAALEFAKIRARSA